MRNEAATGKKTRKKKPTKHPRATSNRTVQRLRVSRFISSFLFYNVTRKNGASVFIADLISDLEWRIRLDVTVQRNSLLCAWPHCSAHNHSNWKCLALLKNQQ